jgi:hypothetical protein
VAAKTPEEARGQKAQAAMYSGYVESPYGINGDMTLRVVGA